MTAARGVIKLIPSWGEIKNRYLVLSGIARALLAGNATAGRDPGLHPRDRGHGCRGTGRRGRIERWARGRALRSRLGERNTNLSSFPPSHAATADGRVVKHKIECIGNSDGTFHFEAGLQVRQLRTVQSIVAQWPLKVMCGRAQRRRRASFRRSCFGGAYAGRLAPNVAPSEPPCHGRPRSSI
jgi:hypothetical protein